MIDFPMVLPHVPIGHMQIRKSYYAVPRQLI